MCTSVRAGAVAAHDDEGEEEAWLAGPSGFGVLTQHDDEGEEEAWLAGPSRFGVLTQHEYMN